MLPTQVRTLELQAKLFRGFADHSRLSILQALRAGLLSVGEIVTATGLTQPNASNHLRCLSNCSLVTGERHGRFIHYRLSDSRIEQLLAFADELVSGAAQAIENCQNYHAGAAQPGTKSRRARGRTSRLGDNEVRDPIS